MTILSRLIQLLCVLQQNTKKLWNGYRKQNENPEFTMFFDGLILKACYLIDFCFGQDMFNERYIVIVTNVDSIFHINLLIIAPT